MIPAFNEARIIENTLRSVLRYFGNVVVVDDCSSDATGTIAQRCGAHVCRHPTNLGQGAALQTGIDYALQRDAKAIVTFDADGQHQPADALGMIDVLDRERCDVVLASRFRGMTEGMSASRAFVLKVAVWYTRLTTGLMLTDTHNGLRVLSRSAAERLRIRQNRMAHAS
ncbi:MAG TPA: glycosyltransferase family 2 protein, partial [Hyphomicrobium sp.]